MNHEQLQHQLEQLIILNQTGQNSTAAELGQTLYNHLPPLGKPGEAQTLRWRILLEYGDALRRVDRRDEAQQVYSTYLTEVPSLSREAIFARQRLALLYSTLGKHDAVYELLHEGLQIAEKLNDDYGRGLIYMEHGRAAWRQNNDAEALVHLQKATRIFQPLNAYEELMHIWVTTGLAYHDLGKIDKAITAYREGFNVARRLNPYVAVVSLTNLGECYQDLFSMEQALTYHQEALQMVQEQQLYIGHGSLADLHRNLGVDYLYLNLLPASREHLEQALALVSNREDLSIYLQALFSLCRLEMYEGQWGKARQTAEGLLADAEKGKNRYHQARGLYMMGLCLREAGQPAEAQALWQKALFLAQDTEQIILLWRLHAALATIAENLALAEVHRHIATDVIHQIADSVEDVELRTHFLNAPEVKQVLHPTA